MELDFTELKLSGTNHAAWISAIGLLIAVLLGVLGWFVLPGGDVLTWTEWQVFQQQRSYQRELARLTLDADRLAGLLGNDIPEPVRAQLILEQVLGDLNASTHPALQIQVDAMLLANDGVYAWVEGVGRKDEAILLLQDANVTLAHAIEGQQP